MLFKPIRVEIAQHEQVLIQEWVEQEEIENWSDNAIFFAPIGIQLQHVHRRANVKEDDADDQGKIQHVSYCPHYERHVKWGAIKQSQPAENDLGSLTKDYEGAQVSQVVTAPLMLVS